MFHTYRYGFGIDTSRTLLLITAQYFCHKLLRGQKAGHFVYKTAPTPGVALIASHWHPLPVLRFSALEGMYAVR